MARNGNRNYGKVIGKRALERVDNPQYEERSVAAEYLQSLIGPIAIRDRSRRWLMYGLEGALGRLQPDIAGIYLEEMAEDIRVLGLDDAVKRFIDKALPKILPNEPDP